MKRRIRKELLDELLADYKGPADMTGPDGLLKQLTGALVERALAAELTDHLGHEPGEPTVSGNARNGTTPKTLTTDHGDVAIETPRDRDGTFEPRLVKKHPRRFTLKGRTPAQALREALAIDNLPPFVPAEEEEATLPAA